MDAGDTGEVRVLDWVRGRQIGAAGCVTLVEGSDLAAVVRGFGGRPGNGQTLTLREAQGRLWEQPVLAVRQHESWVLGVEVNGWQGSRAEVLTRISRGTQAVSAYWSVNGVTRFSYARAGRVLTAFEAMSPDRREGAEPDVLESLRACLPWENDADWMPLMLALAVRVTGERLLPGVFAGQFQLFPLTTRRWRGRRGRRHAQQGVLGTSRPDSRHRLRSGLDYVLIDGSVLGCARPARGTGSEEEPGSDRVAWGAGAPSTGGRKGAA